MTRRPGRVSWTLAGVDTFAASDLTRDHLGSYLRGEGVDGILREFHRVDDLLVQLALDRPPHLVTIPAGRPIEVTSP